MPDSMSLRAPYREIQSAPLPDRFARGWHILGFARDFCDGKPHGIEAFGKKLVVFKPDDGELAVLNGHCIHLGGDLSHGRIIGNTIACPFHDWRWARDGSCASIPYGKTLPTDRTRSWPTREVNGQLLIWYDPEENPPPENVDVPVLEGYGTSEWSDWLWCDEIIETHPRELIDNLADPAHFFYVHGQRQGGAADYFCNVFDKHVATQYMEEGGDLSASPYPRDEIYHGNLNAIAGNLRSESTWHGPAYSVDQLYWKIEGKVVHSVLFLGILPIDLKKFRLFLGVLTRRDHDLDDEASRLRHEKNFELLRYSTFQDVDIWKHKARIDNPMLSETDGPIYRLRRWYEQFYTDIADVPVQATALYRKQVDLTHAMGVWRTEAQATAAINQVRPPVHAGETHA
jgi:3-ketosteroid 9alpha-monooxygenase subunit A